MRTQRSSFEPALRQQTVGMLLCHAMALTAFNMVLGFYR